MSVAVITGCAVAGCPHIPNWLVPGWLRVGKTGINMNAHMASCDKHLPDFGIGSAIGDALIAQGPFPPSRWEVHYGAAPVHILPITTETEH